jgi:hypothetical protein
MRPVSPFLLSAPELIRWAYPAPGVPAIWQITYPQVRSGLIVECALTPPRDGTNLIESPSELVYRTAVAGGQGQA